LSFWAILRLQTAWPSAPTIPPTADRTETNAPTSAPPQNDTTTTLVTPQSNANHRQLLLPNPPKVILETSFTVVTAGNDTGFLTDFREHWDSSPAYVKVLYVLAFIFFFLILFGLGCGMLTWAGFCNKPLALLFPERFQRDVEGVVPSKSSRDDDDNTIDESVGAFSPFARNNNNKEETEEEEVLFMDHYNDEPQPMPRQIVLQRSMSGSVLSTDIEASVGQEENTFPGGRNPKPRNPATSTGANRSSGGRKSIRDRNRAQKARLARSGNKQTINPNRDLAASFLGGYPKRKLASVRSKSPRSSRSVVKNGVVEDEIPREKTASAVRWLREKDQQKQKQQQQCGRSVSSAPPPRRGVNQQFQGSTHSSGLTPRRGGVVLHGNSIPKPAHAVSNVPPRRRSRGFNQQRRGSSHSVSTAPPRSTRGVNQHNMQGSTHSVSTVPPPRSTRGFNQQDLQGSSHSVSTAPPPRRMSGQQQFQGRKNVSGLARSQGDSPLHNSSPATPPQTKRVVRHEKRVSVDIMPMTPDEIDWAMEDAKTQEEEREIQEIRERIRRRKEAKAKAAAAASAAPRWGAIVSHDGNSIPNPEYQQEPVTPPNKSPTVKRRTSQIPMIPEVETVFSDPESMVETDSESVESVDHDYVETLFLVDENNVPHGRDNPRPID